MMRQTVLLVQVNGNNGLVVTCFALLQADSQKSGYRVPGSCNKVEEHFSTGIFHVLKSI